MARKAKVAVNWTRVEELVKVFEYAEDSKADAKRKHKKGDKYERVVLSSLAEINEIFGGKTEAVYRIVGSHLTNQRELRKADPDAAWKKSAKALIPSSQFFETFGLSFVDKANPTADEIQKAGNILKEMASKK